MLPGGLEGIGADDLAARPVELAVAPGGRGRRVGADTAALPQALDDLARGVAAVVARVGPGRLVLVDVLRGEEVDGQGLHPGRRPLDLRLGGGPLAGHADLLLELHLRVARRGRLGNGVLGVDRPCAGRVRGRSRRGRGQDENQQGRCERSHAAELNAAGPRLRSALYSQPWRLAIRSRRTAPPGGVRRSRWARRASGRLSSSWPSCATIASTRAIRPAGIRQGCSALDLDSRLRTRNGCVKPSRAPPSGGSPTFARLNPTAMATATFSRSTSASAATPTIRCAWIVRRGEEVVRLTTCYVL